MMDDTITVKTLEFRDEWLQDKVSTSVVEEYARIVSPDDNVALYYYPYKEDCNGFRFIAVSFISGSGEPDSIFDDPDCELDRICEGYGFFDGIRHVYWGDDHGYINYPNWKHTMWIIQQICQLEIKYCTEGFQE